MSSEDTEIELTEPCTVSAQFEIQRLESEIQQLKEELMFCLEQSVIIEHLQDYEGLKKLRAKYGLSL